MKEISRSPDAKLTRLLKNLSEKHGIPLSTLKFNASTLRRLGLIDITRRNGDRFVRLSKTAINILKIIDPDVWEESLTIGKEIDDLSRKLLDDLHKFLKKINGFHLNSSKTTLNILLAIFKHREINEFSLEETKLILSKGHAAPALYIILKHFNLIDEGELADAFEHNSIIQTHPVKECPTIVSSTGSLGQGISIANGLAIRMKMENDEDYIYVVLGDGELDEGQIWESLSTSATYGLDNIILFIDRNGEQLNGNTEGIKRKEPIRDRLESFGWIVFEANNSKPSTIINLIDKAMNISGWPKAIIVDTRDIISTQY